MDKAVGRLGRRRTKELPSGDGKTRGSTNAYSGKAPDLSGTTRAPLETSFLRRKVATLFRGLRPEKVAPAGQLQSAVAVVGRFWLRSESMADQLSTLYGHLLQDSYDCVDRVILNAYFTMGQSGKKAFLDEAKAFNAKTLAKIVATVRERPIYEELKAHVLAFTNSVAA